METGNLHPRNAPAAAVFHAKAPKSQGKSLESFLASLSAGGAVFLLEIIFYLWLRAHYPNIYKPKVTSRTENQSRHQFRSLRLQWSDNKIISECGLDAFLFIRYLKTLLRIFVPLAILVLPILLPLNLIDGRGVLEGVTGLDRLSWTNVSSKHTNRYWAHLALALVVITWVCNISRLELLSYTRLRHEWLTSLNNHEGTSATTILVTDIPKTLLSVAQLHNLYRIYPHGIRSISINRDYTSLAANIKKRDELVLDLEAAETRLIHKAQISQTSRLRRAPQTTKDSETSNQSTAGQVWKRYLGPDQRERMRLGTRKIAWLPAIPLVGGVVDMIDYYRSELKLLNTTIVARQKQAEDCEVTNSALIQFNRPAGAHMACQAIQHFTPKTMIARLIEQPSTNILWNHVSMSWRERYVRALITGTMIGALIMVFTVPVAFTGLLSQISYLIAAFPRLAWLKRLPSWALVALQGILPPCLLASAMIILPLLLYYIVSYQGLYMQADVELLVQDCYFYFLFIQLFLVVSASSSVAAVLDGFTQDFTSAAALIAQNLPKAGNYFFSYMLLQALSVSAATLLQTGRLILFLLGYFLDSTPRQKWERQLEPEVKWGTFFPVYTNLAVIGLIYSVVSPLILIFNIVTFTTFYTVQRYHLRNFSNFSLDTGGLVYPKAINHLFVGLYFMEIYLVGLFLLIRDDQGRAACIGQAVIMIVVTIATAAYQILLNRAFKPLFRHLPVILNNIEPSEESGTEMPNAKQKSWYTTFRRCFESFDSIIYGEAEEGSTGCETSTPNINEHTDWNGDDVIKNQALTASQAIVWIPRDELGVSKDEVIQTRNISPSILISDENAEIDDTARVHCCGAPPS